MLNEGNSLKITDRKKVILMTMLFSAIYMVSYITRINYGAVIVDMVNETGFSKSLLSMAVTGSFVTYGAGQIISGICGDKFRPKALILYGLILSVLMNLLIPICKSPWQMTVVWCINGFAQAFMWPPLVKIMTAIFTTEDYNYSCVKVSWGASFGTIVIYLIAPLLITYFSWKSIFFFSALCGIAMIIVWQKVCVDVEPKSDKVNNPGQKSEFAFFTPLMVFIMIEIILVGMIRDGVTTWVPSYLSETYNMSSASSILSGVVLPIFSIICYQAAGWFYKRVFPSPIKSSMVFFAAGTVFGVIIVIFNGGNAAVSLISSAILAGCTHGINLMLVSMVPSYFRGSGKISMISGVLNSCTYIGSSISTYGMAKISEVFGWSSVLVLWCVIAAVGTVICLLCIRPWKKRFEC